MLNPTKLDGTGWVLYLRGKKGEEIILQNQSQNPTLVSSFPKIVTPLILILTFRRPIKQMSLYVHFSLFSSGRCHCLKSVHQI